MQKVNQEEPKPNKLRKKARRRQIIELKAQGYTIAEICKKLGVSDSTVDRDLKSQDVQAFIDELVRRQIIDIEASKPAIRLHFRSDLLEKLLPKKMEQKIEGGETYRVEIIDNSKDPEVQATPTTT
jgi:IS30 family transposase